MLAALEAGESETHARVALMEIQASRRRARTGPDGEVVTLDKQDRARWDWLLITHSLAGSGPRKSVTPFQQQDHVLVTVSDASVFE